MSREFKLSSKTWRELIELSIARRQLIKGGAQNSWDDYQRRKHKFNEEIARIVYVGLADQLDEILGAEEKSA